MMEDNLLPYLMIVLRWRWLAVFNNDWWLLSLRWSPLSSVSRDFHHFHFHDCFDIDIDRWRVSTKKKPLPGFSTLVSEQFVSVWMSQQKLVFCVVCNCTSINLSSCKKDLTVQSWWKISRGYFHFLNGTFNFLFIFKLYMFVRQKTLGPKYFPWFSNLSGLCSLPPGHF